jgi:hypothetical protein
MTPDGHILSMSETPQSTGKPLPAAPDKAPEEKSPRPREIGGPKGPEPTRYGDWEVNGRCTDF